MNRLKDFTSKLLGFSYGFSPKIQARLNNVGNIKIKNIRVIRQPIQSLINVVLNALTLGDYNKVKKDYNYDNLYHLKIVINFNFVLEKNERINFDVHKKSVGEEGINVPLNNNNLTINELINNTYNQMGELKFHKYNAFNNNCQIFILLISLIEILCQKMMKHIMN